jgi:hypothetical protein
VSTPDPTRKAALTVADHAHNADECRELLAMLGITPSQPKRIGRPPITRGHGDYRTYRKGCRCDVCREDHRRQSREDRQERAKDPAAADRAGHGNASTYKNYACRCEPCTTAHSAYLAEGRARRRARAALAGTVGAA